VPIRVYIPTPYRSHTGNATHVEVEAASVGDLLQALARRYPGLRDRILDGAGRLPGHLNVYVNQVEVRSLQGEATPLREGDEVALIPAMAGGAEAPALDREQLERYSRHIRLDEVGLEGQKRLLASRVLVVGAGALGSPAAIYLAAAGVGTIGIVDGDRVDLSNLQRQILHFDHDVGRPKVQSARRHLEDINPRVRVIPFPVVLDSSNALDIIRDFDLVINGSDNFPTRYLVNDACVLLGKPLVDASILKWEGQATVFLPGHGCYRCLFPAPPPPGSVPSCAEAGVMGALPGVMGSLQAIEAIKVLLGIGSPLAGRLIVYDALAGEFQTLRWRRNPECPVCGDHPTIRELIDYEGFCGVPGPSHDGRHETVAAEGEAWELSPREAYARQQAGALLIDIREPAEVDQVRIPGAEMLPMSVLAQRALTALDRDQEMIFVCRIGERSREAVRMLRRAGFSRAYNLRFGLVGWVNEGLPVEQAVPADDPAAR
jgi:molybdopterin/thiamine biosynthesis adenylyltransferase/rhodanese-related sulfurtransferase/molybdopterin converting factor small subunit